jgi:ATPase subunit of ABC transporter with duplicated ATPase domains
MPASITLSNLSWSTPDGRPLFSNLDLSFGAERAGLVGRNGVGKSTLARLIAGELQPGGGTISVTGTVGLLRQVVQPGADETLAGLFGVSDALALLRRAETGTATLEELSDADWTLEARFSDSLQRTGLDAAPETLLAALSGGQRTRAELAALLFRQPDFLILDEPTNNLDHDGRAAIIDLLAGWRGGAVIISHDRELLDGMDAIVELTTLGAARYGGNWSAYRARKVLELAAAEHDLADADKRVAEIDRKTQETAERKARRDSAGRRKAARGDMPRIMLGGLKERSETTSGDHARLAGRRRSQALEDAATARQKIEILQPFAVSLAPTGLQPNKVVLKMDSVTAGYRPSRPVIRNLSLAVTGPERIAVTGANGSGKTTLLALVTGGLTPWQGRIELRVRAAALDQQVSLLAPSQIIRDNFRRINPHADENTCRAALARFMFRAEAALQPVSSLSGGQMLRAGLACVLGGPRPPELLILDEPTNHLDIASIETVEAGLRAYDGALIVVSHDEAFLDAIGVTRIVFLDGASTDSPHRDAPVTDITNL